MKTTKLIIVTTTGVCAMLFAGMLASAAPWLARESISELTSRTPKKMNPAEPDAAPNGGPTTQMDRSDVTEGPSSAS